MPNSVHMPDEYSNVSGVAFFVSWERIEDLLRGKDSFSETNAVLKPDENCEFVVESTGIQVYVRNKS